MEKQRAEGIVVMKHAEADFHRVSVLIATSDGTDVIVRCPDDQVLGVEANHINLGTRVYLDGYVEFEYIDDAVYCEGYGTLVIIDDPEREHESTLREYYESVKDKYQ